MIDVAPLFYQLSPSLFEAGGEMAKLKTGKSRKKADFNQLD